MGPSIDFIHFLCTPKLIYGAFSDDFQFQVLFWYIIIACFNRNLLIVRNVQEVLYNLHSIVNLITLIANVCLMYREDLAVEQNMLFFLAVNKHLPQCEI